MTSKNEIYKKRSFIALFHNPIMAWIILFISLTLTVVAFFISSSIIEERARDRFEYRVVEIERAIKDRLQVYEQVLWSGVAFIYSCKDIDRSHFSKFVETLDINKHWPGIQGFGYSVPVKPEDKEKHINQIRKEGFPNYQINPEGQRDMYSSIIYLEPFDWRNRRAFGYDMWSNEMRRAAMKRAMETGEAATSGIITLVQETNKDVQKGFLTYVPVYKTKNIPETIAERKKEFSGWIYAPFRAGNLMRGILGVEDPNIEFEVYDGEDIRLDSLLFDSDDKVHLEESNHSPLFSRKSQITLQGRAWTIYYTTPENFDLGGNKNLPIIIVICGAIVDLLLFYVIFSLYFLNKHTEKRVNFRTRELEDSKVNLEKLVQDRTRELQSSKDNLEIEVDNRTKELRSKISELELLNDATMGREYRIVELKREVNELSIQLGKKSPYDGI